MKKSLLIVIERKMFVNLACSHLFEQNQSVCVFLFQGFTMSRGLKEKYENTNPRRNHTIMSPEEAASGKKSSWTELEITGTNRQKCFTV